MKILGRKWRFPDGVWRKCVVSETVFDKKMLAVGEMFTFTNNIDNTSIAMEMDEFINCSATPLELEVNDITVVMNHGHILGIYVVNNIDEKETILWELDIKTMTRKDCVVISLPSKIKLLDNGKIPILLKNFPQHSEMYFVTPRAFKGIVVKHYRGELVNKLQGIIDILLSDNLSLKEGLKAEEVLKISNKVDQIKKQILSYFKNEQEA